MQWLRSLCHKAAGAAGKVFFLFDTMCGHSSLRCGYDGQPGAMELLINGDGDFYDGGSDDNVNFLFGFSGYDYSLITDRRQFCGIIEKSINCGKPVIVRLKNNRAPFAVIIGYDGGTLVCPSFKAAQTPPSLP